MRTDQTYRGTLHGSAVKLVTSPNLPDGVEVDVTIRQVPMSDADRRTRLESLFGSCEDETDSLDEFAKWNDQQRKRNRNGSQQ